MSLTATELAPPTKFDVNVTASERAHLENLVLGFGEWKPWHFVPYVRLAKKGLAEYQPGNPPKWVVTAAGRDQTVVND